MRLLFGLLITLSVLARGEYRPSLSPFHRERVNGTLPPCIQHAPSAGGLSPIWRTTVFNPAIAVQNVGDMSYCCGGVLLFAAANSALGLNGSTGAVLWNRTYPAAATPRKKSPGFWNDELALYTLASGHVVALNAQTGATMWEFRGASSGWLSKPKVSPPLGLVLTASTTRFFGLDARTGAVRWNVSVSCDGGCSTMGLSRDGLTVYQIAGRQLLALDARDGATQWSTALPALSLASRPAAPTECPFAHSRAHGESIDDSTLVVYLPTPLGASMAAFDKRTGAHRWKIVVPTANATNQGNAPFDTPAAYGRTFVDYDNWLFAFRCEDGLVEWNWTIAGQANVGTSTLFPIAERLVFGADDNSLYVLTTGNGAQVARQALLGDPWSDPVVLAGGQIFIGDESGTVYSYCV